MKLFKRKREPEPVQFVPEPQPVEIPRLHRTQVAMTAQYQEALESLPKEVDRAYFVKPERVYESELGRYRFKYRKADYVAQLIPEPTNTYDPNAIMVYVDGKQIGYVYMSDHEFVWPMLNAGCGVMVTVVGGPYRMVDRNREEWVSDGKYRANLTVVLLT